MRIPDYVNLEMTMANLMAIQEASGFKFDMDAAERVRQSLACEAGDIQEKIQSIYCYYPGKVFTPKRTSAKTGYVAGAPMTKLWTSIQQAGCISTGHSRPSVVLVSLK